MDGANNHDDTLVLAGFVEGSRANGPGLRIVVWVQGCSIGCPGCFNPKTHDPEGSRTPVATVLSRVLAAVRPETAGVTFSGGEPFEQASALARLAEGIRAAWPDGTLMAYSGYSLPDLQGADAPPGSAALLAQLDYLVDGPFQVSAPGTSAWRAPKATRASPAC